MKKWEYKVINAKDSKFDDKKLLEELNLLGDSGWEVISISHLNPGDISRVILKLEK
jgi:hypothetical protein